MKAGWAHSSGIEGVPLMPAAARPEVIFAWRPTTEWASNTRRTRLVALLLLKFTVQYIKGLDGVIRNGRHDSAIMNQFSSQVVLAV